MKKNIKLLFIAVFIFALANSVYAARMVTDLGGTYCIKDDGHQATSEWVDVDGKSYYFGSDHYLKINYLAPDGYKTDATGAWDGNPATISDKANSIVMPTDTNSFREQQQKQQDENMDRAWKKYYKNWDVDALNAASSKTSENMQRGGNATSYDHEMKKEKIKKEIDDTALKAKEATDKLNEYMAKGMPDEILGTLAKNIELYNAKIAKLQQELEIMGGLNP